jgi:hypothetical protein
MTPDGDQPDRASAAAVRFAHEVTGRDLRLEVVPRAGGRDGDARLLREARPGDVIVLAAPPSGAVFSPTAARLAAAGVSVVVLTGPHGSGAFRDRRAPGARGRGPTRVTGGIPCPPETGPG